MKQTVVQWVGLSTLLLATSTCFGDASLGARKPRFDPSAWAAVSDEQLAKQRGGFETRTGLAVSFGIVRTVAINGDVVSKTSFNFQDMANITAQEVRLATAAMAQAGVVQVGAGNSIPSTVAATGSAVPAGATSLAGPSGPSGLSGLPATVVQNSLNGQNIQALTLINTSVNSMALFKSANANATMRDAQMGSIGTR